MESTVCSLYVHIPFCIRKCSYCDFYSVPLANSSARSDERIALFIKALLRDVEGQLKQFAVARVPTVYIGGGTPSLLGASGISALLEGLARLLGSPPIELTVEANPESLDERFLEACKVGGVTRISIGIQSFSRSSRAAIGRTEPAQNLEDKLTLLACVYPLSFSCDLMSGLPGQTEESLSCDINTLLSFQPGHVSLYALTLPCNTAIKNLPDEDTAAELWVFGRDLLERLGYRQYEVSNFSLCAKESLHNLRYWRLENWLGAGPAASGTLIDDATGTGCRLTQAADVAAYLRYYTQSTAPMIIEEKLDSLTLIKETLLMGFRLSAGPDEALFKKRFKRSIAAYIPQTLACWQQKNLIDGLALNRNGILFLNQFLIDCFQELEYSPVRI
ncbi:coproporphyrinogen III oxidase [Spirochaetia bacterium]|nr:coproporphyrinogen III oxidase [Spirochaetia bacterium]